MKTNNTTRRRTDHAPDAYLMDWAGQNLPDGHSYYITDVDMVLRSRQGQLMIVEVKRRGAGMNAHQRATYEILDELLRAGVTVYPDGLDIPSMQYPIKIDYQGFHLLQFENTTFDDGRIFWDRQQVTPYQVRQILSFEASPYLDDVDLA